MIDLDTNILISALIRNFITRKIIIESCLDFVYLEEILIPLQILEPKIKEARDSMKYLDRKDTVFLAAALALEKATLWSDDKYFEKQKIW